MFLGVKLGPCKWRRGANVINKRGTKEWCRTRFGGTMREPRGGRVLNGERLECLACRHTVPMYCSTKSGLLPK